MSEIKLALDRIIFAWDVLPAGYHDANRVEEWMRDVMKPAITLGRAALQDALANPDSN